MPSRPERPGRPGQSDRPSNRPQRPGRPGRNQTDNSLEGEDIETLAEAEVSETLQAFRQAARREDRRFQDATDSEYWVALCFQTREQKEEFLQKLGLLHLGDKYIDGMKVAQILGIELESRVPDMPNLRIDRRYADLS